MMDDGVADTVLSQTPPAGASLVHGGHVMAYTAPDSGVTPETLVSVPDLIGLSALDCARMLRLRGLEINMQGTGVCVRQTPGAGDYAAPGASVVVILSTP